MPEIIDLSQEIYEGMPFELNRSKIYRDLLNNKKHEKLYFRSITDYYNFCMPSL